MIQPREQSTGPSAGNSRDGLAEALHGAVRGEVYFDPGMRRLYATDSSNYRQLPVGVVVPRDVDDLKAALSVCHRFETPVTLRGGGTSLGGQTTNRAVIIDDSKYLGTQIKIDPKRRLATVGPGVVLDRLQEAAAKHGLRFGPDPSTHNNCTIGGMIGNNACGVRSVASSKAGLGARTSDNLAELTVATVDGAVFTVGPTDDATLEKIIAEGGQQGRIYAKLRDLRDRYATRIRERFPDIPRRVSGYNLDELLPANGFNVARALAGTEGTCVAYLAAKLHLIPLPKHHALAVLGFEDVAAAGDAVPAALEFEPEGLEGMDRNLLDLMHKQQVHPESAALLPEGDGWLIAEFGADTIEKAERKARALCDEFKDRAVQSSVLTNPEEQEKIWLAREGGLGATAHVPRQTDAWEGWEDTAVPPEKLGDYLRDLRGLFDRYEYLGPFYGHFGQGLVHTRISFDLKTGPGIMKFRHFIREGAELVAHYGGSLSGEHGDGQSKAEMLEIMFGGELMTAFSEFKAVWDPRNLMNPHKVIHPYRVDENLRFGPDFAPATLETHFKFPEDRGSFAYATERCVGVGNCRKTDSGTMCPSYMATRSEQHVTRGRAHLLFELLRNPRLDRKGWRDKTVKESLDLCLACKACKSECPVNVDVATYKAEFMAHYYKGRLRPRAAYAMGLIMHWARIGARMPKLTNWFLQNKTVSGLSKRIAGLAPERSMPRFADKTFRESFVRHREPGGPSSPKRVLLWVDTFNNHFFPETLQAAAKVLEYAGWRVELPKKNLCCGRPLYDFGMLDHASTLLRDCLDNLQPAMAEGIPIVVLEPSCLSVFQDEAANLFPGDERVHRLKKHAFTLAGFLDAYAPDLDLPKIPRRALVHAHCHQAAVIKLDPERAIFDRLGLDWKLLDSGCCGMAGSFGFEAEKYELSKQIGEQRLLPAARALGKDDLLIVDGFSCREQLQDLGGIPSRHLAEVIASALPDSKHTLENRNKPNLKKAYHERINA